MEHGVDKKIVCLWQVNYLSWDMNQEQGKDILVTERWDRN